MTVLRERMAWGIRVGRAHGVTVLREPMAWTFCVAWSRGIAVLRERMARGIRVGRGHGVTVLQEPMAWTSCVACSRGFVVLRERMASRRAIGGMGADDVSIPAACGSRCDGERERRAGVGTRRRMFRFGQILGDSHPGFVLGGEEGGEVGFGYGLLVAGLHVLQAVAALGEFVVAD